MVWGGPTGKVKMTFADDSYIDLEIISQSPTRQNLEVINAA